MYVNDHVNNVKFTVLENQKKVICTIFVNTDAAINIFSENTNKFLRRADKYRNKAKYTGVAKCAPEDTFNEIIGKDIAFERAYAAFMGDIKRINKEALKATRNMLDEFEKHLNTSKKFNRSGNVHNIIDRNYND